MRVLVVSDLVVDGLYTASIAESVGPIDLILSCGDLPTYYLDFIVSALNAPLCYVYGNHDTGFEYRDNGQIVQGVPGGENLDERTYAHHGLLLAGLAGARRYRPDGVHQFTEREMILKALALVPRLLWNRAVHGRYLDVMLSHAPPFGIHDGPDQPHVGFESFLALMRWFRPRYWLHGHKHVYTPHQQIETDYRGTRVLNVYPFRVLTIEVPHVRPA